MENQKKPNTKKILLIIGAIVLAVVILVGAAYGFYYKYYASRITEGDIGTIKDDSEVMKTPDAYKGDVLNILICGIDYDVDDEGRDYSNGLGMTDVILYVTFDLKQNQVSVLQIPRDSFVGEEVLTGGTCKINAVFSNGDNKSSRISNLAKVINDQYQLPIDRYVTIDMKAFRTIIDTFGGIEMNIPWDIYDDYGNVIEAGTKKIDGATAEFILRQRHMYNTGDYGRLELQQYFYSALLRTLLDCPLMDLVKVAPHWLTYINTDFDVSELMSLAVNFKNLDMSNIYVVRSPGGGCDYYPSTGKAKQSVFNVNAENLAILLNEHFRPYSEDVSVDELNAPKDLEYPLGQTNDPGRYMGEVNG
ncbi:MAG: LCP family protein [Oscillospiraceae bacterium]|nr:LCP family protein [Oscillospiraceae bacterium]